MTINLKTRIAWEGVLAAVLVFGTLGSQAVLAKVGLDSFTQTQQDWLWDRVDYYARLEAGFRVCGRVTNFEQRIVSAVQNCATEEAIQRVRSTFRRKVAAYLPAFRAALKQPNLDGRRVPKIIEMQSESLKDMENAVEDVRRACSTCAIC